MNISIGIAFLAGLASFLSPCVLSLVPAYVGYLGGRSIASDHSHGNGYSKGSFIHGLAFVFGFSVVFIALGLAVSSLGRALFEIRDILGKVGGIIIIILGIHMTGILRIPFLDYELKPQTKLQENRSIFSSFVLGILFSAGWSPCVGPVLGGILTLAFQGGSILLGFILLSAYSAGMAIPFLAAAFGIGWVTGLIVKHKKLIKLTEIVMGFLLIIVGGLLLFGIFEKLSLLGSWVNLGL